MGRLLVTNTKVVKEPYRMKETGHCLYSYEELCYYIYSRMSLWMVEKERVGMTSWLLSCGVSIDKVDYLSPYEAAVKIISVGSYFRGDEKRQILDKMKRYQDFPAAYVEKDKGDLYLSYGKMKNAYFAYENAAFSMMGEESIEWKSSLYHNMGILCCRFFYWDEAMQWLGKAWETLERPETRIALDLAADMKEKDWTMKGGSLHTSELEKKKQEFLNEL